MQEKTTEGLRMKKIISLLCLTAIMLSMSLTALAKLLSGIKYSIAGPKFFKYNGEWLNDIRHRLGV